MNTQDTKHHFPCSELKCEWHFTVTGLTEWSFLEEPGCLSTVPPRLFVLERLGCMKSSVSFKNHSSTQENQIIRVRNGLWKDSNYFFPKHFWGKKKSHKVRSLPPSAAFWPGTAEFQPTGIITLCVASVPSAGTMPHQSNSDPRCCRRSRALCMGEETGTFRNALFGIAHTAAVHRGPGGS